jgi:hypothetical protein
MRPVVLALFLLSPAAAGGGQDVSTDRYIPESLLIPDQEPDFYENWFGGQLRAMGEPLLSRPRDLGSFRRRFRMLVLPTFHPAYAIRIDEGWDGRAQVTAVRLDGAGGYSPGNVAERESYQISRAGIRPFDRALRDSRFRRLSMGGEPRKSPPGTITVCSDGLELVFELVDSQGIHFRVRGPCSDLESVMPLVEATDALRRVVGSDLARYLETRDLIPSPAASPGRGPSR